MLCSHCGHDVSQEAPRWVSNEFSSEFFKRIENTLFERIRASGGVASDEGQSESIDTDGRIDPP